MNFTELLKAINGRLLLMGCIGFVSTLGPGLLTLHRFQPDYVCSFDLSKLVLFSLAVSLPPVLLNSFLFAAKSLKEASFDHNKNIILAAIITAIEHYGVLLAAYFFDFAFSYMVMLFAVVIIIGASLFYSLTKKRSQTSDPNQKTLSNLEK